MAMQGKELGPSIVLFGKKLPFLYVLGAIIIVAGILFNVFVGVSQQKTIVPLQDFEKIIAERINAGTQVKTEKEAIDSIASVSQELEKVRGTVTGISTGLDGTAVKQPETGPSGLVVFSQFFGTVIVLIGVVLILLQVVLSLGKKSN